MSKSKSNSNIVDVNLSMTVCMYTGRVAASVGQGDSAGRGGPDVQRDGNQRFSREPQVSSLTTQKYTYIQNSSS